MNLSGLLATTACISVLGPTRTWSLITSGGASLITFVCANDCLNSIRDNSVNSRNQNAHNNN